jgi:MFS transporter, AAHS family, benzoate transport protein
MPVERLGLTQAEWTALFLTAPAFLLSRFEFALGSLALPDIQASLAIPEGELSLITAIARAGAIPALILALLADRSDRRRMLLFTVFGFALASLATAYVQTPMQYAYAQALSRLFTSADEVICVVILVEAARPSVRGWLIGLLGVASGLGDGLASLAYGFSGSVPGEWRGLFLVGAAAGGMLLLWRVLVRHAHAREAAPTRLKFNAAMKTLGEDYRSRLIAICAVFALLSFPYSATLSLMSKHLQDVYDYSRGGVAALFIGAGAIAILGNAIAGVCADRVGRKATYSAAFLVSAAGFVAFYLGGATYAPYAWTVALFTAFMAHVIVSVYAAELFPEPVRATARSIAELSGVVGLTLGLLLEGVLFGVFGSHALAIVWLWPAALLSIPVMLFLLPETARRELSEIAPDNGKSSGARA